MSEQLKVAALGWGVKESFRRYVEGSGGAIEVSSGAARAADGAFTFAPAGGGDLSKDDNGKLQGQAKFSGELFFKAHGGALSVRIVDPAVEITAKGAVLTVAETPERRVDIALLDLAAMTHGESGEIILPAKLSMDGSMVLGDHYPYLTPIDPVRLVLAKG